MTSLRSNLPRRLFLGAACLALSAAPLSSAAETARFDTVANVAKFGDPACLFDSGKVKASVINGGEILADKKGCISVKGTDGVVYYVNREKKKTECPKRLAQGPVSTVTAGSAGANECKD